jgi:hypothetical protein
MFLPTALRRLSTLSTLSTMATIGGKPCKTNALSSAAARERPLKYTDGWS